MVGRVLVVLLILSMAPLVITLKLSDIKITSDDPALQSPFAKTMIKQMVDDELKKIFPEYLAAIRAEKGVQAERPVDQTLEVEMKQTAGEGGDPKLTVVVVSTWADGTTTRETMPDEL